MFEFAHHLVIIELLLFDGLHLALELAASLHHLVFLADADLGQLGRK